MEMDVLGLPTQLASLGALRMPVLRKTLTLEDSKCLTSMNFVLTEKQITQEFCVFTMVYFAVQTKQYLNLNNYFVLCGRIKICARV